MRSCHHALLRRAFVSQAAILLPLCFTAACADSTDAESRGESAPGADVAPSVDAKSADQIVRDVRATYGVLAEAGRFDGASKIEAAHERTGLDVTIPASAKDALLIAHPAGDVSVAVELVGATDRAVEASGSGHAVYAGAGPRGSDVILAPGPNGVEDFVLFAESAGGVLRYRITPEGVRSLRLVENTLELLDEHGSPKIRVPAPYVVDASGARHRASLEVEGCAVDRDLRSPWGREVEPLDRTSCELVVRYDASLAHPVLVDPEWENAGIMSFARTHHTASLLADGTVLVVGGFDETGAPVAAAEILCPEEAICPGGTGFATTGSLATPRGAHTETLYSAGVLIAGGRTSRAAVTGLASTEIYNTATGTFGAGPTMSVARFGHSSTLLNTGDILVAGGEDGTALSTGEVFDAVTGFAAPITMNGHRRGHMAEALGTNRVLIAGGVGAINNAAVSSAELFDPATNQFTATDNMTSPRAWGTASRLEDANGSVLIAGGTNNVGFYYKTVDVFDPTLSGGTGEFVQQLIQMQKSRAFHAATKLSGSGTVLITGGFDGLVVHNDTEVFDIATDQFDLLLATMLRPHDFHTATLLQTGKAVVIGGGIEGTAVAPGTGAVDIIAASSAEILARENGEPCTEDGECRSNNCYTGLNAAGQERSFCCNESCTDACSSCIGDVQAAGGGGNGFCSVVTDNYLLKSQCTTGVELVLECIGGQIEASDIAPCSPYVCLDDSQCRSNCIDDDDCDDDFFCLYDEPNDPSGDCVARLEKAIVCDRDRQCDSDHCVDGVCCDTECGGQCQACDLADSIGTCNQVTSGQPHGDRAECDGEDPECRGECTNNPTACTYEEKECGDSSCDTGERSFGVCSIATDGVCTPQTEMCAPFACTRDGGCFTECETVAECGEGAVCKTDGDCEVIVADVCDGDHTVVRVDGTSDDCSPFKCTGSTCLDSCDSIDDCVEGMVCDASGACIEPPADPPPPEDCSIEGRPGSATGRTQGVLLALAALALLRGASQRKKKLMNAARTGETER